MSQPTPRQLRASTPEAVHSVAQTRAIEALAMAGLPEGTLMARAGRSVARLMRAWLPLADSIDLVCGPGNNGGDALVAATELHHQVRQRGSGQVRAWLLHPPGRALPADAAAALAQAQAAGVDLRPLDTATTTWPWDRDTDAVIDGLLGIGARPLEPGPVQKVAQALARCERPVLCIDVPSGLEADTGHWAGSLPGPSSLRLTLSLLTLKPGLLTGPGRDLAGQIWFDALGVEQPTGHAPSATWGGWAPESGGKSLDPHAAHKGSYGDVVVMPGQALSATGQGMGGAATLAARAALHAGAGRVYLGVAESPTAPEWDPAQPELMLRHPLPLLQPGLLSASTVVAGCGGGVTLAPWLTTVLDHAGRLVLDADGLNALAADGMLRKALRQRGWSRSVITPHPLEAARLLGSSTAQVMADRLSAARALADDLQAICVLKGAGTVVAAPGQLPWINGTGNPRLATAGTGDVLAGMIGAALARRPQQPLDQVRRAVHLHGLLADTWQDDAGVLTADALARRARPA